MASQSGAEDRDDPLLPTPVLDIRDNLGISTPVLGDAFDKGM
jgi:hypothetical protein